MYKCDSSVYVCVNECVSVDNKKSVCVCVCVDGKFLGDNTQKKFKKERKKERKNLSLSLNSIQFILPHFISRLHIFLLSQSNYTKQSINQSISQKKKNHFLYFHFLFLFLFLPSLFFFIYIFLLTIPPFFLRKHTILFKHSKFSFINNSTFLNLLTHWFTHLLHWFLFFIHQHQPLTSPLPPSPFPLSPSPLDFVSYFIIPPSISIFNSSIQLFFVYLF